MSAFFQIADKSVLEILNKIIIDHHIDIDSVGTKIDVVFAFRDPEGEAPALTREGGRVFGMTKIISLKDRTKGMGDCEILLDGDAWPSMKETQKTALIDHFLTTLEVKRDKKGEFMYDDLQRPMIKLRPHDSVIRLFHSVASRNKKDSLEVQQLSSVFSEGQFYLPLTTTP
jgi:hypothetical protein